MLPHKKSYITVLAISFLFISNLESAQKLTVINNTKFNAALNIELSYDYNSTPSDDRPFDVIKPGETRSTSYSKYWIGYEGMTPRKATFTLCDPTLPACKSGLPSVKEKSFTYNDAENQPIGIWRPFESEETLPENPSTKVKVRPTFNITVKASPKIPGYSGWMFIPSTPAYSHYTFTITQEGEQKETEQTKLKVPKAKREFNPVGVTDNQIVYDDVLINFKNSSNMPLKIEVVGIGFFELNAGDTKKDFRLKSNKTIIPLKIYIPNISLPAEFTENRNTITKYLRERFVPYQDVIQKEGTSGYLVKLEVYPTYIERREGLQPTPSEKEKPWKVEYDIDIKVDEPKKSDGSLQ